MRKKIFLFLALSTSLLGTSWKPLPWNKAATHSQQQQKKWLNDQQAWNRSSDPHVMEHKMKKEHQKWERAQKKREKNALK